MTEIIAYRNPIEAWFWQNADFTYFLWVILFGIGFGITSYMLDRWFHKSNFVEKYYSGICFVGGAAYVLIVLWWRS